MEENLKEEQSRQKQPIPDEINKKLESTMAEAKSLINQAAAEQKTSFSGSFQLSYRHSVLDAPDILSEFERAQSISFISRYENFPEFKGVRILKHKGKFYLDNIDYIRHILNEYRSIILNQSDSVYYGNIHSFCYGRLKNQDPTKGLSITVYNEKREDITEVFLQIIGERNKSIQTIISKLEFDYIYNGILQHSDRRYSQRFHDEYNSGKLNYIFIKHAMPLDFIKESLHLHYRILNQLTRPKLGPL